MKKLPLILSVLLAIPMLVFGANKLIGFLEVPPPTDPTAQMFLGAMFGSYLAKLVAVTEILGALLTLSSRTRLLGALILLPVNVNIMALHLFHDIPGIGPGLVCFVLNIALLVFERQRLTRIVAPA